MTTENRLRVILADDSPEIVDAVTTILGDEIEIVRTVSDGRSLVDGVEELVPDIGIVDISMPIMNGIKATAEITRKALPTKVIFLTVHEKPDLVSAALASGGLGYVSKGRMFKDLKLAIHEAMAGRSFVSAALKE